MGKAKYLKLSTLIGYGEYYCCELSYGLESTQHRAILLQRSLLIVACNRKCFCRKKARRRSGDV